MRNVGAGTHLFLKRSAFADSLAFSLVSLGLVFFFGWFFSQLDGIFGLPRPFELAERAFGLLLLAGGFSLRLWASLVFYRNDVEILDWQPRTLFTTGPYALSRNPHYLSLALMGLGTGLAFNSPLFLLPVALGIIVLMAVIDYEEKLLEREFGGDYLRYKKRVPRWF